jgi:hypothetical protein
VKFGYNASLPAQILFSLCVGLTETFALRLRTETIGLRWFIATSVGWVAAWSFIGFTFDPLYYAEGTYQPIGPTVSFLRTFPPWWAFGAASFCVGISQWLVLRRLIGRPRAWPLVTVFAWSVASAIGHYYSDAIETPLNVAFTELTGWPLTGLVIGCVTAAALATAPLEQTHNTLPLTVD